jgi:hypothetical protein
MNFIPFSFYKSLFPAWEKNTSVERKNEWNDFLASNPALKLNSAFISVQDFIYFAELYDDSTFVLYSSWIEEHKNVLSLLIENKLLECDFKFSKFSENLLFREFKSFLSPFLFQALKPFNREEKHCYFVFSYIPLLLENHAIPIQEEGEKHLQNQLMRFRSVCAQLSNQTDFNREIVTFLSENQLDFVSHFTKSYYAVKIQYIDAVVAQFSSPFCRQAIASWMCKQLLTLQLNPEHYDHIKQQLQRIESGEIKFQGDVQVKKFSWRTVLPLFSIFLLVMGILYVLIYNPFKSEIAKDFEDNNQTAFQSFSKTERMKMDSLIRSMEGKRKEDLNYSDQTILMDEYYLKVENRIPFKNKQAELFVEDAFKALQIAEKRQLDSCQEYAKKELSTLNFNPNTSLKNKVGTADVFLKNESHYDVLICVFQNATDEKLHFHFLPNDADVSFKMNPSDKMFVLPGMYLGKFIKETNSSENPSENYNHHFCFTDDNFRNMLMQSYTLKPDSKSNAKIICKRKSGVFYVLDLGDSFDIDSK